jgi:hypothetical protein
MEEARFTEVMQMLKYANAVEIIDEVLALNPAATVADIRRYASDKKKLAETQLAAAEARIERAVCRHCATEITLADDGTWYHGRLPSWGSRGCRSYSFDRLGTWDENLDRKWKAAPA